MPAIEKQNEYQYALYVHDWDSFLGLIWYSSSTATRVKQTKEQSVRVLGCLKNLTLNRSVSVKYSVESAKYMRRKSSPPATSATPTELYWRSPPGSSPSDQNAYTTKLPR